MCTSNGGGVCNVSQWPLLQMVVFLFLCVTTMEWQCHCLSLSRAPTPPSHEEKGLGTNMYILGCVLSVVLFSGKPIRSLLLSVSFVTMTTYCGVTCKSLISYLVPTLALMSHDYDKYCRWCTTKETVIVPRPLSS